MPFGKPKEPKAPKEKKPKKPKPPKKEKPPKKAKPAKKPQPAKKPKKPKKGTPPPVEGAEEEQVKKKKPILLILIPLVVIAAAAIIYFVVLPRFVGEEPDVPPVETEEPKPPELPEKLMVGEVDVPGMTLEADESEAKAVLAKTVTYTYTDLNDAGAAAKTYVGQLRSADPAFSVVDEEFVRTDAPDFTTAEGMVLLARNLPKPEPEGGASAPPEEVSTPPEGSGSPEESGEPVSPSPEESAAPVDDTPNYVITVRITWSKGQCVVTADEEEGEVTSPPPKPGPGPSITVRGAQERLQAMEPSKLGLPGASMEEYEIFPENGVEMVDNVACIRLDVYDENGMFMGSYLMSINGEHLYQVDPVTNSIRVLE